MGHCNVHDFGNIPQEDESDDDDINSENDSVHDRINPTLKTNCAKFLLTNARSLTLKTDALTDAFESLGLNFAIITETWFKGGKALNDTLRDIEGASGIRFIHKSRDGRRSGHGGGVAIAFNIGTCNFKERKLRNVENGHDIVCAYGRIAESRRPVAVFAVYLPPKTNAAGRKSMAESLAAEVADICGVLNNPAVFVGGDFNHASVAGALNDVGVFNDIATGPTRGANRLDVIYTNVGDSVSNARTLPPLQANTGAVSDHRCVYAEWDMGQNKNLDWVIKVTRKRTPEREAAFAEDLAGWELDDGQNCTVDEMAMSLEKKLAELTDKHFPLRRDRRRSNEDPWITRGIRRLWKKKLRIYMKGGRNDAWWATDAVLQNTIADAKESYVERLLEDGGNSRSFYAATTRLASATNCKEWTVGSLFPGKGDDHVGKAVLDYFGKVSTAEAPPMPTIPRIPGGLPPFTEASIVTILKKSKKSDSMIEGDPLPHLVRRFPAAFAKPVRDIFNGINASSRWPSAWKTEHLTIIPKVPNPTSLAECRNISCTSVFSKILEGQVLLKLRQELIPDHNQYGGRPKCGVEHKLIDLWENVLGPMEGGDKAAVLLGIDYEKAFSRMEHSVCLRQLERLGATPGSLSLVRAFLEDRKMTIKIGRTKAPPVPIRRGSPQGSVLGCLLYCVATQSLTASSDPPPEPVFFPQDGPEDEPVEMWTNERRVDPGVKAFLYVDDTTLVDVVPMSAAVRHITTGVTDELFSGLELESAMLNLEQEASNIGMAINRKKTQLLVISPPNGCHTRAVLNIGDEEIHSQERLKLVGFTFCEKPDASEHVQQIREKFRVRVWMLYHLKRAGFKGRTLYRLYCCYLRTVIEYCSVVYHSLLTAGQSEDLERIHRQAVRICYGAENQTRDIMATEGIETLRTRRERRCDVFIRKISCNPQFAGRWFRGRPDAGHDLRRRREIFEPRSGTARWFNSPLSFLRRRANQLGIAGF